MKSKRTLINTLSSLLLQFVSIISGFIIPRLLLQTFGSEVNGLISSLNQFLNYITLFEGGLNAVILASLYKPLSEKNNDKVNALASATNRFYKKISLIFVIYTIVLGIIYPLVVKTSFGIEYIFTLTLILSVNLFSQYCFSITWRTLLKADKKVYLVSFVQIVCIILNTIGVAILIKLFPNVHIVKLFSAITYLLQPVIFNWYIKKNYNIDKNVEPDKEALAQRWDGLGINIASFIHNNTDVVILTLFTDLKNVSIYSVYYLVTTGLKNLITSISGGIIPTLGHAYVSGDKEKLNDIFDKYELIIYMATFLLFVLGGILITPFVLIYTKGINDANYYQPVLGWIMIMAEFMFCIREPYVNMAYCANKFKEISKYAYIEAIINIVLSIIFVIKFGIIGVAIATFIAMTYRTIAHIFYLKDNILHRSIGKSLKNMIIFLISAIIIVILSKLCFNIEKITILNWIIYAIKNTVLAIVVFAVALGTFYRKQISKVFKKVK